MCNVCEMSFAALKVSRRLLYIVTMNCKIHVLRATLTIFLIFSWQLADKPVYAEALNKKTLETFDRYVGVSEGRAQEELLSGKSFLWIDGLPERARQQSYEKLRRGQVIVQRFPGCGSERCAAIPDGLVHDWMAIVFVPGVSLRQALAALQDYDRDSEYYSPEVVRSKLLSRPDDRFHVYLRLRQKHVITVVLDTEYDIEYKSLDERHAVSVSHSLRIAEVENAGTEHERVRAGEGEHGYLWRLNSYWRFYESDGGVYIQCNALSLTRDIPTGLGWLIGPFIENIPQQSLRFTLGATRKALLQKFRSGS